MSKVEAVRVRLEDYRNKKRSVATTPDVKPFRADSSSLSQRENAVSLTTSNKKSETDVLQESNQKFCWWRFLLKLVVWLFLWGFFISVEFGLVYFVCSCIVMLILSMRGGKKRKAGTLSAYSVFNKNFEVIDGTFTAEQFEKELRRGPTSVR